MYLEYIIKKKNYYVSSVIKKSNGLIPFNGCIKISTSNSKKVLLYTKHQYSKYCNHTNFIIVRTIYNLEQYRIKCKYAALIIINVYILKL